MNVKKVAAGAIVGGIVYFILGYVVWGMALKGFNDSHASEAALAAVKNPPDMIAIALACIATAGLYAVVFDKWAQISTFMTGGKAGALIGAILGIINGFFQIGGSTGGDYTSAIVNVVAWAVVAFVIGGVTAWTMSKVK